MCSSDPRWRCTCTEEYCHPSLSDWFPTRPCCPKYPLDSRPTRVDTTDAWQIRSRFQVPCVEGNPDAKFVDERVYTWYLTAARSKPQVLRWLCCSRGPLPHMTWSSLGRNSLYRGALCLNLGLAACTDLSFRVDKEACVFRIFHEARVTLNALQLAALGQCTGQPTASRGTSQLVGIWLT